MSFRTESQKCSKTEKTCLVRMTELASRAHKPRSTFAGSLTRSRKDHQHLKEKRQREPRAERKRALAGRQAPRDAQKARHNKRGRHEPAKRDGPGGNVLDVSHPKARVAAQPPIRKLQAHARNQHSRGEFHACERLAKHGSHAALRPCGLKRHAAKCHKHAARVGNPAAPRVNDARPHGQAHEHGSDGPGGNHLRAPIARSKTRKMCVYHRSLVLCGSTRIVRTPARLPAMTSVNT